MNNAYTNFAWGCVNAAGFWIESFLSCNLLARFFPPKNGKEPPLGELLAVSALIALALLAADLVGLEVIMWEWQINGRIYLTLLVLLPFLYACVRTRGAVFMKLLISFLFLLLNLLIESVFVVQFDFPIPAFAVFFLRRVLCKVLLYFVVQLLLINVSHSHMPISRAYWLSLAAICGTECLFLPPFIQNESYSPLRKLFVIALFFFIPVSVYYTITRLMRVTQENQVYLSQIKQSEFSQQYLAQMKEMSDSLHAFRHDYKAHLFCMDALLEQGRSEQLHQYLLELHQMSLQIPQITQYTLNAPLNIILNQKAAQAHRQGVELKLDINCPEHCPIQDIDLVTLVSNLLDNALEAAAQAPGPRAAVGIRTEKDYLRIEVANTTRGDVLKQNPCLDTTKADPDAHGFGLKIVQKIVGQYAGMYQVTGDERVLRTVVMLRMS